ncbi:hypothetical protein AvCA_31460 [Azotobacter vinelandii CA]|uniref:Uncharacterized protein n=2 Tax=Azotobacter vinelandii TaxID=354 RepID=C1DNV6_AZOVD|nr:hypothetical protein Avin_31460 [Azotobacter vinelandii DJ]AGK14728.1 hypothetical protein AvCA_31460 [Azotobacter vinelandii CA]AGK21115.1 hypothetical protein AvCA6_31460 [Azotobacter vinelandii CA6]
MVRRSARTDENANAEQAGDQSRTA